MEGIFQFSEVIIFLASIVGGAYGTLVGGASLLMIPLLILLGIPAHVAVASNRFGMIGLVTAGLYKFQQQKLIDWKIGTLIALPAVVGAFIGSNSITSIDEQMLKQIVGGIILVLLILTILKPKAGIQKRKGPIKLWQYIVGGLISLVIGIVASISGGVGTLATYNLIFLFGFTFLESAGTRKITGFGIVVTAVTVFILKGLVNYQVGALIFVGSFIGAWIGTHYATTLGNIWLKRMFFVVVGIMVAKMLL